MRKIIFLALIGIFTSLLGVTSADAATIRWYLSGVTNDFNPSLTYSGYFDYDTSIGIPTMDVPATNWSITELLSGVPVQTWSSSFGDTGDFGPTADFGGFLFNAASSAAHGQLLISDPSFLSGQSPIVQLYQKSIISEGPGSFTDFIGGSLVAAPLPSGILLFTFAIIILAAIAQYRRRMTRLFLQSKCNSRPA